MSDLLTHWGVFDDARRLAAFYPGIPRRFTQVLERQIDYARLGAITRGGEQFILPVLRRLRDAGDDLDQTAASRKLAFALGCITHQPCDIHINELMRVYGSLGKRDISAYYDIHVFRTVYLDGGVEPFSRFMFAGNGTEPGRAAEDFIRSCFQRALLSSHTIKPDLEDIDGWLDRLFKIVQDLYVSVELYVSVYTDPDHERIARYRVETEFYNKADPVVVAARRIQNGEGVTQAEVAHALEADNAGAYAQAVAESVHRFREAARLLAGEIHEFVVR